MLIIEEFDHNENTIWINRQHTHVTTEPNRYAQKLISMETFKKQQHTPLSNGKRQRTHGILYRMIPYIENRNRTKTNKLLTEYNDLSEFLVTDKKHDALDQKIQTAVTSGQLSPTTLNQFDYPLDYVQYTFQYTNQRPKNIIIKQAANGSYYIPSNIAKETLIEFGYALRPTILSRARYYYYTLNTLDYWLFHNKLNCHEYIANGPNKAPTMVNNVVNMQTAMLISNLILFGTIIKESTVDQTEPNQTIFNWLVKNNQQLHKQFVLLTGYALKRLFIYQTDPNFNKIEKLIDWPEYLLEEWNPDYFVRDEPPLEKPTYALVIKHYQTLSTAGKIQLYLKLKTVDMIPGWLPIQVRNFKHLLTYHINQHPEIQNKLLADQLTNTLVGQPITKLTTTLNTDIEQAMTNIYQKVRHDFTNIDTGILQRPYPNQ